MAGLVKGANVALEALAPGAQALRVGLGWQAGGPGSGPIDLDVGALVLGSDGRVSGPDALVYFNRRETSDGLVSLTGDSTTGGSGHDDEALTVQVARLPASVARIVFVVWIHEATARAQSFSQVRDAYIRLLDATTAAELTRFELGEVAGAESAMAFGELYAHSSGWKFRALGQGYADGLAGLARDYGLDLATLDLRKEAAPAAPVAPVAPAAPAATPSRVVLTKAAPSVSLVKRGSSGGVMRVNLRWDSTPPPQAGAGRLKKLLAPPSAVDLDLACLYEFADGTKGVVQALGNAFRSVSPRHPEPLIWLDGDDRSGTNAGGENLMINLGRPEEIRRVLVFAFIYAGVPSWATANAVVTMHPASGPEVQIALDEHDPKSPTCAIALLENVGGEVSVKREVRYIAGSHSVLDQAYGWGMNWSRGRK